MSERCIDGKCESIDIKPIPTPSGDKGKCVICGNSKCCDTCTKSLITVDGSEVEQELCCKNNQVIMKDDVAKCCGGGQVAIKNKTACGSPCGNGIICDEDELCASFQKQADENQDDFSKRINALLKGKKYILEGNHVKLCVPKNKCTFSDSKRFPAQLNWFYQDPGTPECLDDYNSCEKKDKPVYYSGKDNQGSAYSAYIQELLEPGCGDPEQACLQRAVTTAGVTKAATTNKNQCNFLVSGNSITSFMDAPIRQNEICQTNHVCKNNGEAVKETYNCNDANKCELALDREKPGNYQNSDQCKDNCFECQNGCKRQGTRCINTAYTCNTGTRCEEKHSCTCKAAYECKYEPECMGGVSRNDCGSRIPQIYVEGSCCKCKCV